MRFASETGREGGREGGEERRGAQTDRGSREGTEEEEREGREVEGAGHRGSQGL